MTVWQAILPLIGSMIVTTAAQPLVDRCAAIDALSSEKLLVEPKPLPSTVYRTFLKAIAAALASNFMDRLNFYALCTSNYLKSSSSRIRANAALFIGTCGAHSSLSSMANCRLSAWCRPAGGPHDHI
jgi:hypothetical protein